jgi:hypothetical protein
LEATARGAEILREGRRRRVKMLVRALPGLSEEKLREAAAAAEFMRKLIGKLESSKQ